MSEIAFPEQFTGIYWARFMNGKRGGKLDGKRDWNGALVN